METTHVLLGMPWIDNKEAKHDGITNMYSFKYGKRKLTLIPMSPEEARDDRNKVRKNVRERKENLSDKKREGEKNTESANTLSEKKSEENTLSEKQSEENTLSEKQSEEFYSYPSNHSLVPVDTCFDVQEIQKEVPMETIQKEQPVPKETIQEEQPLKPVQHITIIPSAPLLTQPSFGTPLEDIHHTTFHSVGASELQSIILFCHDSIYHCPRFFAWLDLELSTMDGWLPREEDAKDDSVRLVFDPGGWKQAQQ